MLFDFWAKAQVFFHTSPMQKVCIDDWIVVEIPEMLHGSSFKLLHLKANTTLNLGKKLGKISAEKISGLAYDCYWEIVGSNSLQPCKPESFTTIDAQEHDIADNKDFFDDNSAQLLDAQLRKNSLKSLWKTAQLSK